MGEVLDEAEAEGSAMPSAIAAIRLLLLTGCRKNEIVTLRWDDIDRTAGELRLSDAKSGPRAGAVGRLRREWVLDRVPRTEDNPWVFAGEKKGAACEPIWTRYGGACGFVPIWRMCGSTT